MLTACSNARALRCVRGHQKDGCLVGWSLPRRRNKMRRILKQGCRHRPRTLDNRDITGHIKGEILAGGRSLEFDSRLRGPGVTTDRKFWKSQASMGDTRWINERVEFVCDCRVNVLGETHINPSRFEERSLMCVLAELFHWTGTWGDVNPPLWVTRSATMMQLLQDAYNYIVANGRFPINIRGHIVAVGAAPVGYIWHPTWTPPVAAAAAVPPAAVAVAAPPVAVVPAAAPVVLAMPAVPAAIFVPTAAGGETAVVSPSGSAENDE